MKAGTLVTVALVGIAGLGIYMVTRPKPQQTTLTERQPGQPPTPANAAAFLGGLAAGLIGPRLERSR